MARGYGDPFIDAMMGVGGDPGPVGSPQDDGGYGYAGAPTISSLGSGVSQTDSFRTIAGGGVRPQNSLESRSIAERARDRPIANPSGMPGAGDLNGPTPGTPGSDGEIAAYITQAAQSRGIDPRFALLIAEHEGGVNEYNRRGTFSTGSSWWPYQLHYGGAGTPYAQYGDTAGMGNDFTARTGYQPGDPNAWKASVDFALDHARRYGWGAWYGRGPAGVGEWDGIPR